MTVPVTALFGGIRGTIAAGVAVLALVAAGAFCVLWQLADARFDACDAKTGTYQATQQANGQTIDRLRDQIAGMIKKQKADTEAASKAAEALAAENAKSAAELAETRKELADVYARSPAARAWSRVGVPRDVADRLPRPD